MESLFDSDQGGNGLAQIRVRISQEFLAFSVREQLQSWIIASRERLGTTALEWLNCEKGPFMLRTSIFLVTDRHDKFSNRTNVCIFGS